MGTTATSPNGYIPCDVAHAYGLYPNGLDGAGISIAVIAAGDEPNLAIDLHNFDAAFGLADPELSVVAPFGHTSANLGWPLEIATDVEWTHAAAPGAAITVVEAATDQLQQVPSTDLLATTLWAVQNVNPDVVVLPWGANEAILASVYGSGFEAQFNTQFFPPTNLAGNPVTYLAPAGTSNGFETVWPAVATTVVGVGGTSLAPQAFGYSSFPGSHLDCSGASPFFGVNQTNEIVWGNPACSSSPCSGTGGGPSAFEAKPDWQSGFGPGSNRLSPDVAILADPVSGVATYLNGSWNGFMVGGLGVAVSLWAGVVATADQQRQLLGQPGLSLSDTASWIYSARVTDFNDIVTGGSPPAPNHPCLSSGACVAGPGYDQVTGRGSPLVPALVGDLGGTVAPPPGSATATARLRREV